MEVKGRHQIVFNQSYLECTDGSSNKFYRTLVIGNKSSDLATLICTYGPIGRAGTSKVTHGLSMLKASNEAIKKVSEKERKGYKKVKAKDVFIGSPGHLIAHTFGEDRLKDREVHSMLAKEIGRATLDEIMEKNGWLVEAETAEEAVLREKREAEAAAKAKADEEARIQAELDARTATYSSSWGEWA